MFTIQRIPLRNTDDEMKDSKQQEVIKSCIQRLRIQDSKICERLLRSLQRIGNNTRYQRSMIIPEIINSWSIQRSTRMKRLWKKEIEERRMKIRSDVIQFPEENKKGMKWRDKKEEFRKWEKGLAFKRIIFLKDSSGIYYSLVIIFWKLLLHESL